MEIALVNESSIRCAKLLHETAHTLEDRFAPPSPTHRSGHMDRRKLRQHPRGNAYTVGLNEDSDVGLAHPRRLANRDRVCAELLEEKGADKGN